MTYPQGEPPQAEWHYFQDGQNYGPVTAWALAQEIAAGTITAQTKVFRSGMPDWMPLGQTELAPMLAAPAAPYQTPAPYPAAPAQFAAQPYPPAQPYPAAYPAAPAQSAGAPINNNLLWTVACLPYAYFFVGAEVLVALHAATFPLLPMVVVLGIVLCYQDCQQLKSAGIDVHTMGFWILLIPIYLFLRIKRIPLAGRYTWWLYRSVSAAWYLAYFFGLLRLMPTHRH